MVDEEPHSEPMECKFCEHVQLVIAPTDTEECEECGQPFALEPLICKACNFPNNPEVPFCEMCRHALLPIPIRERVKAILKKYGPLPLNTIAIETEMGKKKSNLSYYLSELVKDGLVLKIKIAGSPPKYSLPSPSASPTEEKIWEYLSHDNFKMKSKKEIMENVQGLEISEVDKALKRMLEVQRIEVYHNKPVFEEGSNTNVIGKEDKYCIPFWNLPDNICHHCRKPFDPVGYDELVISQMMIDPADNVEHYPIHATCRSSMIKDEQVNEKRIYCDYCGLSLTPSQLYLKEEKKQYDGSIKRNRLLESGLETLFDEPYSKIFPYLQHGNHFIDYDSQAAEAGTFGGMFMPQGFMHYVRKHGKQYHPYCAKQVK